MVRTYRVIRRGKSKKVNNKEKRKTVSSKKLEQRTPIGVLEQYIGTNKMADPVEKYIVRTVV